jgi:multiple sugar transport system permease protein
MSFAHPRRRPRSLAKSINRTGLAFVSPFLIVLIIALIVPAVYAVYVSMFKTQLVGGMTFIGIGNYITALQDPAFLTGLARVFLFGLVQVPIMLILSVVAALALDSARLYGASLFRISLFLPHAVPSVVIALMWGFMFGINYGLVGNLNSFFGWQLPNPLGDNWIYLSLGNIITWEALGYNMLVLYAALTAVPRDLYEAAELDGASRWQVIRAVKIPAMRGALVVSLLFSVIGTIQLFNSPNVLSTIGPTAITSDFTPNMYAYTLSFGGQQQGYGAAIAIITGVITAVFAYVVRLGQEKDSR